MVTLRSAARAKRVKEQGAKAKGAEAKDTKEERAPPNEFGGPYGVVGVILALPTILYTLYGVCHPELGCPNAGLVWRNFSEWPAGGAAAWAAALQTVLENLVRHVAAGLAMQPLWSWHACGAVLLWVTFQIALHAGLPGKPVDGTVLVTGKRLKYKSNGTATVVATAATAGAVSLIWGARPWLWITAHYVELMSASIALASTMAVALYAASFRKGRSKPLLARPGSTGYAAYDFFMGRELNPRITLALPGVSGGFVLDLKYFCELRPGLLGWCVLNTAFAVSQSCSSSLSAPMVMVLLFQAYYVLDALWNEPLVLSTMDITTDGFGFMLAFGDLAWVPFTFSLQARYLSLAPVNMPPAALAAIFALHTVGFVIFRSANRQKHLFCTQPEHPAVRGLASLSVLGGKRRLLVDGWWGRSRHINYFGDWLMGLSWCLCCGLSSPVPFFYSVYFAALLLNRQGRDDAKCRAKYGQDWATYCDMVPYRIVPYVY